MTPTEYIKQALNTLPADHQYFPEAVSESDVLKSFEYATKLNEFLDRFKKQFAYGKDPNTYSRFPVMPMKLSRVNPHILHGMIGIATESLEIMEGLERALFEPGVELDVVNLAEEMGDVLWYMAIILNEIGGSFEMIMATNIAKSKKRFPNKFTSEDAINRDTDAERDVLESFEKVYGESGMVSRDRHVHRPKDKPPYKAGTLTVGDYAEADTYEKYHKERMEDVAESFSIPPEQMVAQAETRADSPKMKFDVVRHTSIHELYMDDRAPLKDLFEKPSSEYELRYLDKKTNILYKVIGFTFYPFGDNEVDLTVVGVVDDTRNPKPEHLTFRVSQNESLLLLSEKQF